jgi:hypothetical protein
MHGIEGRDNWGLGLFLDALADLHPDRQRVGGHITWVLIYSEPVSHHRRTYYTQLI